MKKILSVLFLLLLTFTITACGSSDNEDCRHRDKNDDGKCDKCSEKYTDGADISSCQHRDSDDNGKCDKCGADYTDGKDIFDSPTEGIIYEISEDGMYAIVVGYQGTMKEICIADTYGGVPVQTIGNEAFKETAITKVVIPDSVVEIGMNAFFGCSDLANINFGDSVVVVGDHAFDDCHPSLYNGFQRGTYVGDDENPYKVLISVIKIVGLDTYEIHEKTEIIAASVFRYCEDLTNIEIPTSVISIGDSVFNGCVSLKSITIPDSLKMIDERAFYNCESLASVSLGSSLETIGYYAFYGCTSLASVIIPESVIEICYSAFSDCTSLASVTISNPISIVGEYAFDDCHPSLYQEYENGLYVGDAENPYAILIEVTNTELKTYTIHEKSQIISSCTYKYMYSNLTSVIIPSSVISIGEDAFYLCSSLENVYYKGDATDWASISIFSNNEDLTEATRYYYSETAPTAEGNFWHYGANGEIEVWP